MWALIVQEMTSRSIPLPQEMYADHPGFENLDSKAIEHAVVNALHVQREWLKPRRTRFALVPKLGVDILSMEVFLDHYLICVYGEGTIGVWDLDSSAALFCGQHLTDTNEMWTSSVMALESSNTSVIAVLTRTQM